MKIAIDIPDHFPPAWKIAAGALEYETQIKRKGGGQPVEILLPWASRSMAEDRDPANWDAAIVRKPRPELDIPQVLVVSGYESDWVSVTPDDDEIGRLAVAQFVSMGLSNFAFFGREEWSPFESRKGGFFRHAESRGISPKVISSKGEDNPEGALCNIPKPCGVMAFNDSLAFRLMNICKSEGLHIPRDIHIISVDNTPGCMECTPTLASVAIPFTLVGYHAVGLCEKMISGQAVESIQVPPSGLIVRDSVRIQNDDMNTATEIAYYLRMNLAYPIQMEDLERRSSLSGRHLSRVFSSTYGMPPIAYLKDLRLEHAKKMLRSGDAKVKDVANECGYRDTNHLCRTFRERVGLSPQAYAQTNGKK